VEATANGAAAEVVSATGWPGLRGIYRVEIRIPSDAATGMVKLRVIAAFFASEDVEIAVR
jgi:uncharacterized protein (TIGR03437 family)